MVARKPPAGRAVQAVMRSLRARTAVNTAKLLCQFVVAILRVLGVFTLVLAGLDHPPGWALLAVRIRAEERLLCRALRGYAAYVRRTPSRLIPGLW